jgi:hypothetical protein
MTLYPKMAAVGVSLASLLLVVVAWCSDAQAIEGPFYSEAGSRLLSGESAQFKTGIRAGLFVLSASKLTLTCEGTESLRGSQFKGSTGHGPGRLTETLIFTGCTIAGNGTGCSVGTERNPGVVETKPLLGTLAYPKNAPAHSDKILEYLYPEAGVTAPLMEVVFRGGTCITSSVAVEGSVTGEVDHTSTESIKVGEEPAEIVFGGILFAPTNITSSWEELGESIFEEQHPALSMAGEAAQLEFNQVIYLVSKNNWSVYT